MGVIEPWTYCEDHETHSRYTLKPGDYRAKNLKHQPGAFEMTDLVPLEQLRGAVDLLHDVAISGVESELSGYVTVQIDRATWDALAAYRGQ